MSGPSSTQANVRPKPPEIIPEAQKPISERATNCISRVYTVIRKIESLIPSLLKVVVSVANSVATVEAFAHLASSGWTLPPHSLAAHKLENPFEEVA